MQQVFLQACVRQPITEHALDLVSPTSGHLIRGSGAGTLQTHSPQQLGRDGQGIVGLLGAETAHAQEDLGSSMML